MIITTIQGMLGRWAVDSQQTARRNAMIASTALTQRRAELNDVEDFLASHSGATSKDRVLDTPAVAHG